MSQPPDPTPHAVVSCGSHRWTLTPGEVLTFGRGHRHALRIGHAPEDLRVPRSAGRFECRADGVLVHNTSDKRTLAVQTFPGPGYEILPLMIIGTHPHPQVRVIVKGLATAYAITVDTRPLAGGCALGPDAPSPTGDGMTTGFERVAAMSRRHRVMLTALCLPLLTRGGDKAEVPTYAQMEIILREHGHDYKAHTLRNSLDELRSWLTYEHDVDGLLGDGSPDNGGRPANYIQALAQWAILSGNVTDLDLDRLEADDHDRRRGRRTRGG